MKPRRFLRLTPPPPGGFDKKTMTDLLGKLSTGVPLDPLFLDVGPTGDVLAHEGRHRAEAARTLGIRKVPVILYHRDADWHYAMRPEGPTRLRAQRRRK
jgi:hypothetical protein